MTGVGLPGGSAIGCQWVAASVMGNDGKLLAGAQPILGAGIAKAVLFGNKSEPATLSKKSASGCFRREGHEPSQQPGGA
jgi:hypothetical protein